MKYKQLGRTRLKVSELCLGTMQFGWTADLNRSFKIMDAFFEAGGNPRTGRRLHRDRT